MGGAARLSLVLLACACGDAGTSRDRPPRSHARGPVVARVQGTPVGLAQVRELVEATGLSPRAALSRLEDALLLEQAALERGYGRSHIVTREARRALVQALLAETVEAEERPERISEADVRARFESQRQRLGLAVESYLEHEAVIRAQLVTERRKAALEKLLSELRAALRVTLDETEVRKLLSDPALWGGGT